MNYLDKKIVIIGAGPSALSLAATLELAKLPYVILEKNNSVGGQLSLIHNELDDFVGGTFRDGIDFVKRVIEFYDKYRLNIEFECEVKSVDILNKKVSFVQNGIEGSMSFDILVIATGSRCRKANKYLIEGIEKDVFYRISHVLDVFDGKKIAVIGGGDNATIAALRLADIGNDILLIDKNLRLSARPDLISEVVIHPKIQLYNNMALEEIEGTGSLKSIICMGKQSGKKLAFEVDKIVFKIGYLPNTEIVSGLLKLDDKGYVLTKGKYHTSTKNVFAIGDIVSGAYKRISIVMGHGTDLGNYFLKDYLVT